MLGAIEGRRRARLGKSPPQRFLRAAARKTLRRARLGIHLQDAQEIGEERRIEGDPYAAPHSTASTASHPSSAIRRAGRGAGARPTREVYAVRRAAPHHTARPTLPELHRAALHTSREKGADTQTLHQSRPPATDRSPSRITRHASARSTATHPPPADPRCARIKKKTRLCERSSGRRHGEHVTTRVDGQAAAGQGMRWEEGAGIAPLTLAGIHADLSNALLPRAFGKLKVARMRGPHEWTAKKWFR
ncbi:hypothetical protein B0H11DRAFT_2248537 [Mycena galericulata]|nr:hypothetical protein B0H11DRAFT_2248537 [Mycena galericulata]